MPLLNVKQCLRQELVQLPSKSLSLGQYFPGIFVQPKTMGEHTYQDFADALHGVATTFWRHGIHCIAFSKGPKISQKHQNFHESDSSADMPEIFSYISSNICRVEAAGFPGVRYSEKLLHPQILTRQTSKKRQFSPGEIHM